MFVVTVLMAKLRGRAKAVASGRRVFVQLGKLSRPQVMDAGEYEAVLRRWIGFGEGVKLLVLEVLTTTAFLGLLFSWDHEDIVFGRADKAMTLYGAVLMAFLSSAFMFDPTSYMAPQTTSGWRCGTCLCRRR